MATQISQRKSATDTETSAIPATEKTRIEGFGMACAGDAILSKIHGEEELSILFERASESRVPVGFRGAGASYGDAALSTNHYLCDLSSMNRILEWNPETGVLCAEAGATIAQIWKRTIADGYWPPIVSGTMTPTLGGAVSMNIHGKNCWKSGPIGDHVLSLRLITPSGDSLHCSRDENPDLFHAVIGGFGMLGCITEVAIRLKRINSGLLEVRAHSAANLEAIFAYFETALGRSDYIVGWLDCFAKGKSLGRGLVHEARYLKTGEDPDPARSLSVDTQRLPDKLFAFFPKRWLWRLVRPFTNHRGMRLVNAVKYYLGRLLDRGKPYLQSLVGFNFLLDAIPDWKKVYLPGGFIQHQSFVPAGAALEVIEKIIEITHKHRIPPFLAVFKRHRPDPFLLTHGLDGYSLALDFPINENTRGRILEMTAEIDALVAGSGGRFYPAKDATLKGATFRGTFPDGAIDQFLALKARTDPHNLIQTDLSNRLLFDGPHNPGIL